MFYSKNSHIKITFYIIIIMDTACQVKKKKYIALPT